jgi:hypothetical protein
LERSSVKSLSAFANVLRRFAAEPAVWLSVLAAIVAGVWMHASVSAQADVPIYEIQGAGTQSPYVGQRIDTSGIVTAVAPRGFYLQDPQGDGRANTSDGIFVYTDDRPAVKSGDCVRVRDAVVDEYYDKTELARASAIVVSAPGCGDALLQPPRLPAPQLDAAPAQWYEPFEGMLVTLGGFSGVVQGPTKRFRSGEAEIAILEHTLVPFVSFGRIFHDETGELGALLYVSGALGAQLPDANRGDTVILGRPSAPAQAIVDYNFGKYQVLLLPGERVVLESAPESEASAAPASVDEVTVCTFNLMAMGRGSGQFAEEDDYERELLRRARTIAERLGGCTVVGVQEVGTPADLQALAEALMRYWGLDYVAVAQPGPQTASVEFPLTNGLLVRRDRVVVDRAEARQACSAVDYGVAEQPGVCQPDSYALFDRTPLVADVQVHGAWGGPLALRVIVNHWKSKAGDETVNTVRRQEQAAFVTELARAKLAEDANAGVIVLGDLNDYYASTPVELVRTGAGLVNMADALPGLDRYTYIFNGASQTLDHVLVSPGLRPMVSEVKVLHVNADFAAPVTEVAGAIHHASDHDPVLVRLTPRGGGWLAVDARYPGVQVSLRRVEDGAPEVGAGTTDAEGQLRLWNLPPGDYQMRLTAPAHVELATTGQAVTVKPGGLAVEIPVRHRAVMGGAAAALSTIFP